MKISRTKCFVMAGVMALSVMSSAFAAKFPDVTSTSYGWALEAVEEMTESGIIKGYEDGSFRPANTVTKLEKGESVELDIQAQIGYKMKKSK